MDICLSSPLSSKEAGIGNIEAGKKDVEGMKYMVIEQVRPGTKAYKDVKYLYDSAFASLERLPFSRMMLLNLFRSTVDLLAYYEAEEFCGMSFTVCTDEYLYVDFFAVDPNLRGQGQGSRMLTALKNRFGKPAVGECRMPIPGSPDYDQDFRRAEFWRKNGFDFFDNKVTIENNGVTYLVNSTEPPFHRDAYWAIFDHLSFGPKSLVRRVKRKLKK